MLVPGSARTNGHLGRNIRQTTHFLEKHGFMTSIAARVRQPARSLLQAQSYDVAGDCAVYMVRRGGPEPLIKQPIRALSGVAFSSEVVFRFA
jgi:hypothetical protein